MSTKVEKTLSKNITKPLPCKLTDGELLGYGRDVAAGYATVQRLESELDGIKQDYKGKITVQEATIGSRTGCIASGSETRDVKCVEVKNWTDGTVVITRLDTAEIIESRPMREDEKQQECFSEEELSAGSKPNAGQIQVPGMTMIHDKPTDAVIKQANETITEASRAGVSVIQRRMKVGGAEAQRIMDELESRGIVGPATDEGGVRELLIPFSSEK